jgi:tetratricopeptide (TPR) repeat protein
MVPMDAESGNSIDELSRSAQVAKDSGRLFEAVSHWEAILAIDPTHGPTRQALGDEYLALGLDALSDGELDRAIDLWERAERANPTDPRTQGYLEWGRRHRERVSTILGR